MRRVAAAAAAASEMLVRACRRLGAPLHPPVVMPRRVCARMVFQSAENGADGDRRCSHVRLGCVLFATAVTALLRSTACDADAVVSTGIAYDTVLKFVSTAAPTLRAGDFAADFADAMTPHAGCMPDVVRRYITPERERIDGVCKQDATIVDCSTRTVTVLDLQQKQYARTSLDLVYDDGIADMRALSDQVGSTSTIAIERSAKGTRTLEGTATDEYLSVRTQTVASPGLSVTTRGTWTYDFLPDPLPTLSCVGPAAAWLSRYGNPQQYAPELQAFFADRFSKMAGPRDRITESGPRLPDWRIPLYAIGVHEQRQTNVPVWTRYFAMESGNVRAIQGDDPVFTVPAGYTKMAK